MRGRQPETKSMSATAIRQDWSSVLNCVARKETRVLVEKSGAPVAAIVSADDLERLQRYDAERAEHFKALEQTGEAFKDVPLEELEREVAKALAEVRAENRVKRQRDQPATHRV